MGGGKGGFQHPHGWAGGRTAESPACTTRIRAQMRLARARRCTSAIGTRGPAKQHAKMLVSDGPCLVDCGGQRRLQALQPRAWGGAMPRTLARVAAGGPAAPAPAPGPAPNHRPGRFENSPEFETRGGCARPGNLPGAQRGPTAGRCGRGQGLWAGRCGACFSSRAAGGMEGGLTGR